LLLSKILQAFVYFNKTYSAKYCSNRTNRRRKPKAVTVDVVSDVVAPVAVITKENEEERMKKERDVQLHIQRLEAIKRIKQREQQQPKQSTWYADKRKEDLETPQAPPTADIEYDGLG
jgi:hypothetical protein